MQYQFDHKTYYDNPTQVEYYDFENDCYVNGIAYKDEIICLCCGGVIGLEDLFEDEDEFFQNNSYEEIRKSNLNKEFGCIIEYDWENLDEIFNQ